jgi:hypothetical protein
MRRVLLALTLVILAAAPAFAQAPPPAPKAPSDESIALARRYLELTGMPEQYQASFESTVKPMIMSVRTAVPTMSNDTAARLDALLREEFAKTQRQFIGIYARRLAERLSEDDLRINVRLMESDPAVARMTAAIVDLTPELTEQAVADCASAMAMATSRLRRERRL